MYMRIINPSLFKPVLLPGSQVGYEMRVVSTQQSRSCPPERAGAGRARVGVCLLNNQIWHAADLLHLG